MKKFIGLAVSVLFSFSLHAALTCTASKSLTRAQILGDSDLVKNLQTDDPQTYSGKLTWTGADNGSIDFSKKDLLAKFYGYEEYPNSDVKKTTYGYKILSAQVTDNRYLVTVIDPDDLMVASKTVSATVKSTSYYSTTKFSDAYGYYDEIRMMCADSMYRAFAQIAVCGFDSRDRCKVVVGSYSSQRTTFGYVPYIYFVKGGSGTITDNTKTVTCKAPIMGILTGLMPPVLEVGKAITDKNGVSLVEADGAVKRSSKVSEGQCDFRYKNDCKDIGSGADGGICSEATLYFDDAATGALKTGVVIDGKNGFKATIDKKIGTVARVDINGDKFFAIIDHPECVSDGLDGVVRVQSKASRRALDFKVKNGEQEPEFPPTYSLDFTPKTSTSCGTRSVTVTTPFIVKEHCKYIDQSGTVAQNITTYWRNSLQGLNDRQDNASDAELVSLFKCI